MIVALYGDILSALRGYFALFASNQKSSTQSSQRSAKNARLFSLIVQKDIRRIALGL